MGDNYRGHLWKVPSASVDIGNICGMGKDGAGRQRQSKRGLLFDYLEIFMG